MIPGRAKASLLILSLDVFPTILMKNILFLVDFSQVDRIKVIRQLLFNTKFCETSGGVVVLCSLGWVFSCWGGVCVGLLNREVPPSFSPIYQANLL